MENINQQGINQQNTGSSSSTNINCGTNLVDSSQQLTCPSTPGETPASDRELSTTIVSNTVPVPPDIPGGRLATTEVSCPDGTVVTGGGYEVQGVFEGISDGWTWLNAPTNNGWRTAIDVGATEDDATLTVYAICGSLV